MFSHPEGQALHAVPTLAAGRAVGRIVVVALLTAVALAVGGSAHANGSASRCALKGSRTVAKTASARVFKRNGTTYACLYSANRRVRLGTFTSGEPGGGSLGQRGFRLAGRYVAFEDFQLDFDFQVNVVVVVNLRSGRRVINVDTGKTPRTGGFVAGIGPTTQIRLRATGQVAWIAQDISTPATRYEVRKREARGRGRSHHPARPGRGRRAAIARARRQPPQLDARRRA